MKKTLIATAIAGAMSFSVAAQAAPTVYGNIQLAVDLQGHKNTAAAGEDSNAVGAMTAGDNGSTIGFKGEEALENGLTAIYKAEFHFKAGNRDGAGTNGLSGSDQNYIGVKGDFGTVRVGAFDTVANDFVQDMVYSAEVNGTDSAIGKGNGAFEHQQVQYTGEFGGIKVGASVLLNGAADGADKATKDREQAVQVGVVVPAGPAQVSAAYDSVEGDMGVGFKMPVAGLNIGAKFETGAKAVNGKDETVMAASVDMNYGMGNVYAIFSNADVADQSTVNVGASYNLSDNLYTYVEVGTGDADKGETQSGSFIGAVMSF